MSKTIGIIGFGNMGSAITEQIKNKYRICVFDKDSEKTKGLKGVTVSVSIAGLAEEADAVVLAVKPQDFDGLLKEFKTCLKKQLIISIAAGITTAYVQRLLGNARVARAMPNIGAKIGKSVTCICKGALATDEDIAFALELFRQLGEVRVLPEEMMNAATAISGSGPGYYFDFIESNPDAYKNNPRKLLKDFIASLTDAAETIGFSREEGKFLSIGTGNASEYLLVKTKLSPAELKKQITSKGGTTEAALEVLHRGGSLVDAVKAAVKRAQELSK